MANITQIELQHLKHLINCQNTIYQKLINYADYAVDPQFKQAFNKAAQNSLTVKEKLLTFFN